MSWKTWMAACSLGVVAPIAATHAAESAGTLAIAVLRWEGEYGTDLANGGATTPTTSAIYSVDDGEPRPLVDLGGSATYPRFNRKGDWLYLQSTAGGKSQIYRCRPDGSMIANLSARHNLGAEWNHAFGASLSGDGTQLVYSVQDGTGTGRIVYCNADGSNAQWVMPDLGYIYMAALDQTGASVAFSGPARDYRLLTSDRPFTQAQLLTPDHPESFVPQYSPSGSHLIFLRRDGDIYSMDLKTKLIRRLTEGNGYVEFKLSKRDLHGSTDGPHLSRDGKRIAYIAKKDGIPQVCVMHVDGSNQKQITHLKAPCGRVRWHPDGSQIAFVSLEGAYPQLFVVDARGGEPRQVTKVDGAVYWVDWRP